MLHVEPAELDLARFERLRRRGARGGRGRRAARSCARRSRCGAGRRSPTSPTSRSRRPRSPRLEELRWAALEQRIDADLAAGRHAELVGELEALIAAHPLRERLRAQLMLALYRSGAPGRGAARRTARARRELADELGLEPSEELRRLEQAILHQDPELERRAGRGARRERLGAARRRAALDGVDALLRLAAPLAAARASWSSRASSRRSELGARRRRSPRAARRCSRAGSRRATAAFSSPAPGDDVARLAAREGVDLLLVTDGEAAGPRGRSSGRRATSRCSWRGTLRPGPVLVPFGGGVPRLGGARAGRVDRARDRRAAALIGATADGRGDGRDASRLLADASLIVQRTAAVVAEPRAGARPAAAACGRRPRAPGCSSSACPTAGAQEGLGRARAELVDDPPAPTVLVRRGPRPGGLAPREAPTRFGWSLTAGVA